MGVLSRKVACSEPEIVAPCSHDSPLLRAKLSHAGVLDELQTRDFHRPSLSIAQRAIKDSSSCVSY